MIPQPSVDLNTVPHPVGSILSDNHAGYQDLMSTQDDTASGGDSPSVSDSESSVTGGGCGDQDSFNSTSSSSGRLVSGIGIDHMVKLNENDGAYQVVKQRFLSCVGEGGQTELIAIHRRNWLDFNSRATLISFQIYTQALAKKNGCETNVKYAWFTATSRKGIDKIVSHGFGYEEISTAPYGQGIYLSAVNSPFECVQSTAGDDDGLRYVLLCRVLVGRSEGVSFGSLQTHPSSSEFDSGVDSITSPRKYIIWSSHMNTHILPEFVVSFRSTLMPTTNPNPSLPKSSWMPFPALLAVLSRILPQEGMNVIRDKYKQFKERSVTRDELVRIIRLIAGDKLLKTVIISCKEKGLWMDRTTTASGTG